MRSHFSYPYFQFIKHILIVNYTYAKTQLDMANTTDAMVCLAILMFKLQSQHVGNV